MSSIDWNDLRYFLAVARHGTLSAAARVLRVAQPTVGRRVDACEQQLGARLFDRSPAGHRLTAAGHTLLAHVERMDEEAIGGALGIAGRDAGVAGTVRITCSEWLAVRLVGPLIAPLLAAHPSLTVDVVADARHLSLVRHEADLALRPREFEQDAVHQRRVGRIELALYASEAYLVRHGRPVFDDGAAGHSVIVMDASVGDVARPWLARWCTHARVAARTNGREAMATMAAAGVGLACLPRVLGVGAGLVEVAAPELPEPMLWLGVHRDARTIPRVKLVTQFLSRELLRAQK